jgi:small multidrug resistance pump
MYLRLAIVFEVAGTTCMKLSAGLARVVPTMLMEVCYCICFGFLTLGVKKIEVSVAYAVWSGVGMGLITLVGIAWFQESMTLGKAGGILAIIGGVIALNLARGSH